MNILTGDLLASFYPRLTAEKRCIPGWAAAGTLGWYTAYVTSMVSPLYLNIQLMTSTQSLGRPCGSECPRLKRLLSNTVGVAFFIHGHGRGIQQLMGGSNYEVKGYASCENPLCKYKGDSPVFS
jgi:hypothetical protein